MEEQVVFYFSLVAGMLIFASVIALHGEVSDAALMGEATVLLKNLDDTVQQVNNSPLEAYVEAEYELPEKLGGRDYKVRIQPAIIRVIVGTETIEGELDVANYVTAGSGDTLIFYKQKNSDRVFVRKD